MEREKIFVMHISAWNGRRDAADGNAGQRVWPYFFLGGDWQPSTAKVRSCPHYLHDLGLLAPSHQIDASHADTGGVGRRGADVMVETPLPP